MRRAADKGLRNPNTALGVINAASSSVKMDSTLDVGTLLSLASQFQRFNPEALESWQVPTVAAPRGGVSYQDVVWAEADPLLEPFRGIEPTGLVPSNVIVTVTGTSADRELLDGVVGQLDAAGFDADVKEQRSGVKHKEKFKELFLAVDVLTLSATPIPRTLYMALMGVRDMSTIDTPPSNRTPVETVICGYDERVIKKAIERALNRPH